MVTDETPEPGGSDLEGPGPARPAPAPTDRLVAFVEILLCSGYPTQLTLGATLIILGVAPEGPDGELALGYVVALSLLDTVLLIGLILLFLSARRESPRRVLLGDRPPLAEVRAGVPLTLAAFFIAVVVLGLIQWLAPGLHTVEQNPLRSLMQTPRDAALFGVVAVVAGGVREEIQRAFLLYRIGGWLGGPRIAVLVSSVLFGAGHLPQGADAAIATGLLGAFWALVYLRRQSVIAPMVSHAGFNLLQLGQFFFIGR